MCLVPCEVDVPLLILGRLLSQYGEKLRASGGFSVALTRLASLALLFL